MELQVGDDPHSGRLEALLVKQLTSGPTKPVAITPGDYFP
jgi:hypothetical protein